MFDELERLGATQEQQRLLGRYAEAGAADRDAWQDRVMHLEGVEPRGLVKLHGELLACGWVEQNTGNTPALKPGVAACCYRVTAAGLRALRQARGAATADDGGEGAAAPDGTGAAPRQGGAAARPGVRAGRGAKAARAKKAGASSPGPAAAAAGGTPADPT
jgi:hypothetical protein